MYIKINNNGNIAAIGNKKLIRNGEYTILNPKHEHYIAAGFLPVENENEQPEEREGYTSKVYYKYNETHTGIIKVIEYTKINNTEINTEEDNIIEDNEEIPDDYNEKTEEVNNDLEEEV